MRTHRRTLLKQVMLWSFVVGCLFFAKATSVSAHANSLQNAAVPTPPVLQQTPTATSTTPSAALPDGPGKETLIKVCTKCHAATQVMANRRDRQGWEDTITKMAGMGAAADDAEFAEILEYLVKNYSPLPAAKIDASKAGTGEPVILEHRDR